MNVSKVVLEYGITMADYNKLCRDNGVIPIYNFNKYFINDKLEVFKLVGYGIDLKFVKIESVKYAAHKIPMYRLINDDGMEYLQRVDYLYLSTWYGPMPLNNIHYTDNEVFSSEKNLYYSVMTIIPVDDSTKIINGIEFKRVDKDLDIFVSKDGVIYDEKFAKIRKHLLHHKLYHYITHKEKLIFIHRAVYSAWKNNGVLVSSDMLIDHIDGFKNHNSINNLKEAPNRKTIKENIFRRGLRNTTWSQEVIEYLSQMMEDGTMGPKEMFGKVKERYPEFTVSYPNFKRRIYELLHRGYWSDITSKYQIDNYIKNMNKHPNTKSEDELIHLICKAYVSGKYKHNKDIAKDLGVSESMVNMILRKEKWTDISDQYDIDYVPRNRGELTEDEIKNISNDIMDGIAIHKIAKKYNRDKRTLRKIIQRQVFPEVTSHYKYEDRFPKYDFVIPYSPINVESPYVAKVKPRELRGSLAIFTLLNYISDCVVAKGNA